jgi:ParB family chromosome partitioning protein
MSTITTAATEYRNLPLSILTESKTNPRRIFDDAALKELAESIRSHPGAELPANEQSVSRPSRVLQAGSSKRHSHCIAQRQRKR